MPSPADVGFLDILVERVRDGTYPEVHAILLMKDGRLAFERYFPGNAWDYDAPEFRGPWTDHNAETPHNLASVTKSITGLLVVLAVDRGMIRGFDEPLCGFFPEHAALCDGEKAAIHLGHVLTMTSGLAWNEQDVPYSDPSNDIVQLFLVEDPIAHVLSKPVVAPPASRWSYNGGGTNLLGKVVERASGMRLDAFAQAHLFEPLGIRDATWQFVRPGFVYASGDMTMRPRDMAKIGQMSLVGGVWEGKRILLKIGREWDRVRDRVGDCHGGERLARESHRDAVGAHCLDLGTIADHLRRLAGLPAQDWYAPDGSGRSR